MTVETDRLISARPSSPQEGEFERSLRPATLAEYVGQEKVRGQLDIYRMIVRDGTAAFARIASART